MAMRTVKPSVRENENSYRTMAGRLQVDLILLLLALRPDREAFSRLPM
jgi:hypothetical protein